MTYLAHPSLCDNYLNYLNFERIEEKVPLMFHPYKDVKHSHNTLWPASRQFFACARTRRKIVLQQNYNQITTLVVSGCISSYAFLGLYWVFIFINLFLTFLIM